MLTDASFVLGEHLNLSLRPNIGHSADIIDKAPKSWTLPDSLGSEEPKGGTPL